MLFKSGPARKCPCCPEMVTTTAAGKIAHHGTPSRSGMTTCAAGAGMVCCRGSGQPPASQP